VAAPASNLAPVVPSKKASVVGTRVTTTASHKVNTPSGPETVAAARATFETLGTQGGGYDAVDASARVKVQSKVPHRACRRPFVLQTREERPKGPDVCQVQSARPGACRPRQLLRMA